MIPSIAIVHPEIVTLPSGLGVLVKPYWNTLTIKVRQNDLADD